jgi:hypothetical protein
VIDGIAVVDDLIRGKPSEITPIRETLAWQTETRKQLGAADRPALEAVAREKYKRGRVSENDLIVNTLAEVVSYSSNSGGVSLYAAKGRRGCPKETNA